MNFMFSWQEQYLTRSLRSLVRYCSCHSNIKFISSRHRVISSIYYQGTQSYCTAITLGLAYIESLVIKPLIYATMCRYGKSNCWTESLWVTTIFHIASTVWRFFHWLVYFNFHFFKNSQLITDLATRNVFQGYFCRSKMMPIKEWNISWNKIIKFINLSR